MAAKFYHCNICGNVMAAVVPSGVTPVCCDSKMTELDPEHHTEGTPEHHIPEVTMESGNIIRVKVGKELHPAIYEHHICFIVVETEKGAIMRNLEPTEVPEITIRCDCKPIAVYAYCNKHGLWRTLVKCPSSD